MNSHQSPAFEPLESRRMLSAGDLDTSFGIGGKLAFEALPFKPHGTAMQADGKLIAVGQLDGDFAVARLNPDGRLDPSFGTRRGNGPGVITTDFGGSVLSDVANAVAIRPDGKIVFVGRFGNAPNTIFGRDSEFAVVQYNADGSLDKSFSGDGKQTISFNGHDGDAAKALAIQPDGKVVIVGSANSENQAAFRTGNGNSDFALTRLNRDGSIDKPFGAFRVTFQFDGRGEEFTSVKLTHDGKVVVGGHDGTQWLFARFNADGTRDKSFGFNGISTVQFRSASLNAMALTPDNGIVAVGDSNSDFAVMRLDVTGKLAAGGTLITGLAPHSNDSARSVQMLDHGRMLVSGTSGGNSAMVMYTASGALDTTFGNKGIVVQDLGGRDVITDTRLTSDGKILTTGLNHLNQIMQGRFLFKPTINHNINLGGLTFIPRAMTRLFSDKLMDVGLDASV